MSKKDKQKRGWIFAGNYFQKLTLQTRSLQQEHEEMKTGIWTANISKSMENDIKQTKESQKRGNDQSQNKREEMIEQQK